MWDAREIGSVAGTVTSISSCFRQWYFDSSLAKHTCSHVLSPYGSPLFWPPVVYLLPSHLHWAGEALEIWEIQLLPHHQQSSVGHWLSARFSDWELSPSWVQPRRCVHGVPVPVESFVWPTWNCLWLEPSFGRKETRAEVFILVPTPQENVRQGFRPGLPFSPTAHLINLQSHKFTRIKVVSEGTSLRHGINQPEQRL